jgi:DNA processing protein
MPPDTAADPGPAASRPAHPVRPDRADDAVHGDATEQAAWLRLLLTPGLGREAARRLLAALGSPQAVWRADPAAWRAIVGPALAQAMGSPPERTVEWLAQAQAWLAAAPDRRLLTLADTDYPPLLLNTADPPLLLFVQGPVPVLSAPAVAIVGSRHPTAQGRDNANAFAADLSAQGLVVVSGLAQGIDAAAHEGALKSRAPTVAVVGTGPDLVYPPRHAALLGRILAGGGVLVSEFAPGTPPLAEHFPQRNRIIAGLSLGTLVVEAALRSGSLITARMALEAGREVFAVPGSIHAPQSRGCHALLRQGAKLVESAQDVLEDLPGPWRGRPAAGAPRGRAGGADGAGQADMEDAIDAADGSPGPRGDALQRALLAALGHDPVTLDALVARTGAGGAELLARLLDLELDGRVARLPGGLFQRRGAG